MDGDNGRPALHGAKVVSGFRSPGNVGKEALAKGGSDCTACFGRDLHGALDSVAFAWRIGARSGAVCVGKTCQDAVQLVSHLQGGGSCTKVHEMLLAPPVKGISPTPCRLFRQVVHVQESAEVVAAHGLQLRLGLFCPRKGPGIPWAHKDVFHREHRNHPQNGLTCRAIHRVEQYA